MREGSIYLDRFEAIAINVSLDVGTTRYSVSTMTVPFLRDYSWFDLNGASLGAEIK
jgi:hypothetical protein